MKNHIILIDGSAFIYRAYYAIKHLSNTHGQPTNAIYGFITMLDKLLATEDPAYIAVCFDRKEPTFRHKKYPAYKAQRKPTPEDLIAQMPHIKDVVRAYNIPVIEMAGYEADDLLATYATKAVAAGLDVAIATGDKDIFQIVSDHIRILSVHKEGFVYNTETIKEKFDGLGPDKIVDLLALMGDASDNIPGVPGVGEKTAIKLLTQFGSIEGIYENIDTQKGALQKKLIEHKHLAELSKELVTLECNVPIEFSLDALKRQEKNNAALKEIFTRFEFKKMLASLDVWHATPVTHARSYMLIDTEDKLRELITNMGAINACAIDTETTGPNAHTASLLGISISYKPHEAYYIPWIMHAEQQRIVSQDKIHTLLKPLLENAAIKKYGQNIKYDLIVLLRHGFTVTNIAFDTMIASYILSPNKSNHNLDDISLQHLGIRKIHYADLVGTGKNQQTLDRVSIDRVTEYACEDADCVLQLVPIFEGLLAEHKGTSLFYAVEMPLVSVLATMEMNGVSIDQLLLKQLSSAAGKELEILEQTIYQEAGEPFNINSPKQVGGILFDKLQLPSVKKTKTGYSTDVTVLAALAHRHRLPKLLLEYREITKLKSTYLDALPEIVNEHTHLVHASFNQTITATGRLSSSSPNLQNIPIKTPSGRKVREAFVPRGADNILLAADYSQIELRILAHLSHDENLTKAFRDAVDVHAYTASLIFACPIADITRDMRTTAKTINFSVIYGKTAYGLSQELDMHIKEASAFIEAYFVRYHGVKAYLDTIKEAAKKTGYTQTILGRKCYFPDINSTQQTVRQFAERAAINAPIQGSAADLIKIAMINIQRVFDEQQIQAKMIMQVHDELVFDVPKDEKEAVTRIVRHEMERALNLDVPLVVDMTWGNNWAKQ